MARLLDVPEELEIFATVLDTCPNGWEGEFGLFPQDGCLLLTTRYIGIFHFRRVILKDNDELAYHAFVFSIFQGATKLS